MTPSQWKVPTLICTIWSSGGVVLTFLMVYADRVGREKAVNPEEMMEQFPQLSAEARLVCSFMGANVLRDTRRWLNRQKNQAARRPEQKGTPDSDKRVREDMARARRALERSLDTPLPPEQQHLKLSGEEI